MPSFGWAAAAWLVDAGVAGCVPLEQAAAAKSTAPIRIAEGRLIISPKM
jgi:hypothetical protein